MHQRAVRSFDTRRDVWAITPSGQVAFVVDSIHRAPLASGSWANSTDDTHSFDAKLSWATRRELGGTEPVSLTPDANSQSVKSLTPPLSTGTNATIRHSSTISSHLPHDTLPENPEWLHFSSPCVPRASGRLTRWLLPSAPADRRCATIDCTTSSSTIPTTLETVCGNHNT